jgi:hypothetical protein
MLRNIPAVQFVFAKFAALLRSNKGRGEPLISEFRDEAPGVTRNTVDQHAAVLKPSSSHEIAAPETNDQSEREKLIRRRWSETGIKMWNPDVHGTGQAALNIQGRVELLPVKPGETLPGYDKLEFKMVRSYVNGQRVNRIACCIISCRDTTLTISVGAAVDRVLDHPVDGRIVRPAPDHVAISRRP